MLRVRITPKTIRKNGSDRFQTALLNLGMSSIGGISRDYVPVWANRLFGEKTASLMIRYRVVTSGKEPTKIYLVPGLRLAKVFIPPFFQRNTFFSLLLDLIYSPITMSKYYWSHNMIDSWSTVKPHLWKPFERLLKFYRLEGPVDGTYYQFSVYRGEDRLYSLCFSGVKYGTEKRSLTDIRVGTGVSKLSAFFDMYWDKFSGRYVYERIWGLKVDVRRMHGRLGKDGDCFLVNNYDVSSDDLRKTGIMVLCLNGYETVDEFWFLPGLWWTKYSSPVQMQYFYVLADAPKYYLRRYLTVVDGDGSVVSRP